MSIFTVFKITVPRLRAISLAATFAAALILPALVLTSPALAASFAVDDLGDATDASPGDGFCDTGGGVCTLRAAVMETNALVGADSISLPAGTITLDLAGAGDGGDDLDITEDLEITGLGPEISLIDANAISRAFLVSSGIALTVRQLGLSPGTTTPSTFGSSFRTESSADLILEDFNQLVPASGLRAYSEIHHEGDLLDLDRVDFINGRTSFGAILIIPAVGSTPDVQIADSVIRQSAFSSNPLFNVTPRNSIDVVAEITRTEIDGFTGVSVSAADLTTAQAIVTITHSRFSGFVQGLSALGLGTSANLTRTFIVEDTEFEELVDLGFGAAIWAQTQGTVTQVNLTRVTAVTVGNPGLFVEGSAAVAMKNTTFSGPGRSMEVSRGSSPAPPSISANNVTFGDDILSFQSGTMLALQNSIVAGRCTSFEITGAGNLFADPNNCTGTVTPTGDPMLGALADNGGDTRTMALLPGSDAIDAASALAPGSGGDACEATDQRGLVRPTDGDEVGPVICDVGAYEVGPPPNLDYGDAPDSYQTLFASDGARHRLSALLLGAEIDEDMDGQPSALATGDDMTNLDDEDGVVITSALAPGGKVDLEVTSSGAGFFSLWLDIDQSGDFTGEQMIQDAAVVAGVNLLSFVLPAQSNLGQTLTRSRLDSSGGLDFFGGAADGEVEDDLVEIKELADLAITEVTSDRPIAAIGGDLSFTATATNLGPADVTAASLTSLDFGLTFIDWTCAPSGGASCPASGSGDLSTTVDLPVGSTVVITANATVDMDAPDPVSWRPRIFPPATGVDDPDMDNDFILLSVPLGLFGDGFESGDLSAWSSSVP